MRKNNVISTNDVRWVKSRLLTFSEVVTMVKESKGSLVVVRGSEAEGSIVVAPKAYDGKGYDLVYKMIDGELYVAMVMR